MGFLELHQAEQPLLLANAWDAGSARLLESLGFDAVATTSSGHAATLGRLDGEVDRAEALAHAAGLVRSEEHTSELQSRQYLVCRLLLEKKKPFSTDATNLMFPSLILSFPSFSSAFSPFSRCLSLSFLILCLHLSSSLSLFCVSVVTFSY